MFGMLEDLAKATVGLVIETPIAVVADVVTMGGVLTDKDNLIQQLHLRRLLRT